MEMFVARHCLLQAFNPDNTDISLSKHVWATLLLWLATLAIAMGVPNLGLVIGSVSA
jgi:hypothetical protein